MQAGISPEDKPKTSAYPSYAVSGNRLVLPYAFGSQHVAQRQAQERRDNITGGIGLMDLLNMLLFHADNIAIDRENAYNRQLATDLVDQAISMAAYDRQADFKDPTRDFGYFGMSWEQLAEWMRQQGIAP